MKSKFVCHIGVNWDASKIKKVIVSTNNEYNAVRLAVNKLSKKYDRYMMTIRSIKKMCV